MAICNVHPHVNVRRATPMPDKGGSLEAPVVPDAVTAEVITLVKGEVALIEAAILFQRNANKRKG